MFVSRRLFLVHALGFALAGLLLPACGSSEAPTAREHFAALAGDWEGTHRLLDNPNEYAALYAIAMDGETLVHSFSSTWEGGFTGHERMTFLEDGSLMAVWSDSTSDETAETAGSYDSTTRTLTMHGDGESWTTPDTRVEYEHITVYQDDTFSYTMSVTEDGEKKEVMWLKMTRKAKE
jgi:uncharacterized protein DUF1579